MAAFRIFMESKADIVFTQQYIKSVFDVDLAGNTFFSLNGHSGYKAGGTIFPDIQLAHDNGEHVVLILDADNDFDKRQREVENDFHGYNIPMQLFLFPNNADTGNLETLLCTIAHQQDILRCFEDYEQCIAGYQTPVIKSKVFAYLDALLPEANKKNNKQDLMQEANRDYTNPAHWNLTHEYLIPLHTFLRPLLQP